VCNQSINRLCTGRWSPWHHRCTACCGKSILHDITVTFLYISPKTPPWSWTWLYLQKANKMVFPSISCPYGNIVNFPYTSWIHFSANRTSFRPFKWMGVHLVQSSTVFVPNASATWRIYALSEHLLVPDVPCPYLLLWEYVRVLLLVTIIVYGPFSGTTRVSQYQKKN